MAQLASANGLGRAYRGHLNPGYANVACRGAVAAPLISKLTLNAYYWKP